MGNEPDAFDLREEQAERIKRVRSAAELEDEAGITGKPPAELESEALARAMEGDSDD
jgi:hypothetical protein